MLHKSVKLVVALLVIVSVLLTACAPTATPAPTAAPAPTQAPTKAPEATKAPAPTNTAVPPTKAPEALKNSVGVTLPADAAPLDKQIFRGAGVEGKHFDATKNIYESSGLEGYALEPLVWLDYDFQAYPGAAEKWETSADGLTWTFYLRKTAKWSDGTPITADDWVYSIRRMMDPATANPYGWFYYGIENAEAIYTKKETDITKLGVSKKDDYTLLIKTAKPIPYMTQIVGFIATIAPKHIIEKAGENWAADTKNVLSNGPYMVKEWNKGKNVIYVPNPKYDGPAKPKLEQIITTFVPQSAPPSLYMQMYKAGELDYIGSSGAALKEALADTSLKGQVETMSMPVTFYMHFPLQKAPFDNLKVRQAFSHAIDRKSISEKVMQGLESPAYAMIPPVVPCSQQNNPEIQKIQAYDPELAKKLLAEAGYPDGKGFPALEMWTRQGQIVTEGEAIQRMLKDNLGITVTPKDVERSVYMAALGKYEVPLGLIQWAQDYSDPTNFMDWWTAQTRHPWKNEKFNELVNNARGELDKTKRCAMYNEAEKILISDVGGVFIGNPVQGEVWKPNVGGLKVAKNVGIRAHYQMMWSDIYIKK